MFKAGVMLIWVHLVRAASVAKTNLSLLESCILSTLKTTLTLSNSRVMATSLKVISLSHVHADLQSLLSKQILLCFVPELCHAIHFLLKGRVLQVALDQVH